RFDVAVQGTGEGLVGLWTEPGAGDNSRNRGALFDDVIVRSYPLIADDFYRPAAGRWTPVGTGWKLTYGESGQALAEGTGLLLAGPAWTDGTWSADLRLERGAVGLVVGTYEEGHGYGVRLRTDRAELVKLGPEPTVVDSIDHGVAAGNWVNLALSRDRGLIRASLDGRVILETFDAAAPGGRCGLLAEDARAAVDNCQARFEPTFWQPPPTLPAEFENDQYMTTWAGPGAAWIQVEGSEAHWHKGFFYGDRQVKFTIPGVGEQEGRVAILMSSDTDESAATYRLELALSRQAPKLRLALRHGGQTLGSAEVAEPGDQADVQYELRGRFLVVWVNGECVLSVEVGR
ncbi:MAG: hypothetical protein HXY24_16735, partial [Rubrivivax sp.]|nr:hypothetical protein [Rubrivivax sp.]